jgi:hypothetical protein
MSDLYDVSFKLILQGNHKQDLYLASQTKSRHHRGQLLQLHLSPPAFQKGWIYPDPAHARSGFFCLALVQTLRWIKFIKSIKISQLSKLSLPYPQNCPPKFAVMICVAVDAVFV